MGPSACNTRLGLSGSSQPSEAGEPDPAAGGGSGAGEPDPGGGRKPGILRRRLLGRREPRAGRGRTGEGPVDDVAGGFDPEIAEMRRDIAALWLAFNHHERTLRDLAGRLEASTGVPASGDEIPGTETVPDPGQAATPISEQLSDLDDVLAAIERATEVLERTHADEIERPGGGDEPAASAETRADGTSAGEPGSPA